MAEIEIIPGITPKDWDELSQKVGLVAPYVRRVHINISDGSLEVGESLLDYSRLTEFIRDYPKVSYEAHLLTANPEKYVRKLTDVGFTRLIAHVESNDPRRFLHEAKYDDVEVSIAVDGATEIEVAEPYLEELDFVTVMTAEAGSVAGAFLPEAVEKIKIIHQNYPDLPIEAVGGLTDKTSQSAIDAGATRLVSVSYIFSHTGDIETAIAALKG